MRKTTTLLTILLFVVFMVGCENSVNPIQPQTQNDNEEISLAKKGGNKGGWEIDVIEGESIQDAIDNAVDGDIIKVGPGTYDEALLIDGKDISLIASGEVIIAPLIQTAHGDAISVYNGKVSIVGFKIDANNCKGGIYAGGGFPVNENAVVLDALNNNVYNYLKNGITINGSRAYGNVIGNTTLGGGPIGVPHYAQNGIQFGYGAKGKAMDNTVTGNWYTGDDWGATGILIFEANDVLVQRNKIVESEVGVAAQAWGWYLPSVNMNRIIKNTLIDCEWGISVSAYSWTGYSGMDTFANNNKITNNIVKAEPGIGIVGVEVYTYDVDATYTPTANNNKIIHNTIEGYPTAIDDTGSIKSKIHANVVM